jgi:hypothetical protein
MLKVTFTRPKRNGVRSMDAMQALASAILEGPTPADVEPVLIDQRLEPIRYDETTDPLATSVELDVQCCEVNRHTQKET